MNRTAPAGEPIIVAWLGYGGLLPFLALAVLVWLDPERAMLWHDNLRAYSAVILSFVGALHWGFAMTLANIATSQRNAAFAWSVMPSLIAFASLATQPLLGDILLASGFLIHYWQDRRLAAIVALPGWYLPLRFRLSAVAILCIVVGAFAIFHQ